MIIYFKDKMINSNLIEYAYVDKEECTDGTNFFVRVKLGNKEGTSLFIHYDSKEEAEVGLYQLFKSIEEVQIKQ